MSSLAVFDPDRPWIFHKWVISYPHTPYPHSPVPAQGERVPECCASIGVVSGWHATAGAGPEQHHTHLENDSTTLLTLTRALAALLYIRNQTLVCTHQDTHTFCSRTFVVALYTHTSYTTHTVYSQQQNINTWVCAQKQEPDPPSETVVHAAWLEYKPKVRSSSICAVVSLCVCVCVCVCVCTGDHQPQQAHVAGSTGVPAVQPSDKDARRKRLHLCLQQREGGGGLNQPQFWVEQGRNKTRGKSGKNRRGKIIRHTK